MTDQFPRLYARTQRFTLGRARNMEVTSDGGAVWLLASDAGDDPLHHLWRHDVARAVTTKVVDARTLDVDTATLTVAERARRERAREGGGGITSFSTDASGSLATFMLGAVAFVVDAAGTVTQVVTDGPAHDPRLSADGRRIALVVGPSLHAAVVPVAGRGASESAVSSTVTSDAASGALSAGSESAPVGAVTASDSLVLTADSVTAGRVAGPDDDEPDTVSWGLAEFVAAEEMGRSRGHWWSPDGESLLVARVDESDVVQAWLADPVHPRSAPRSHRYPFAGTTNATVDLHVVDLVMDGDRLVVGESRPVTGDRDHYLVDVSWTPGHPALATWQNRPQTAMTVTTLDVATATMATRHLVSGTPWIELAPGSPTWSGDRLITVEARMDMGAEGTHAVMVDGTPVSPTGLQVRAVVGATADRVTVSCTRGDASSIEVVDIGVADGVVTDVAVGPGVHAVVRGGDTVVTTTTTMDRTAVSTVRTEDQAFVLEDRSVQPPDGPAVQLLRLGDDGLLAGLVTPDGPGPFPVLLDPYGGPHAQRVLQARSGWSVAQWFASQGFAVLTIDNRGAPGRSPVFEHAIAGDFATGVLADQVAALEAAAAIDDRLDLTRVGIRGWSFGGYLAALAGLRRPDIFRAAVVGAPVTDWRLYDTHYTERYLGHPDERGADYDASSLVDLRGELVGAVATQRPAQLLVIHGLVDDNVLAAHSLRLSRALLAAGQPHRFLPLSGVTHMTPQEVVAANLLLTQVAFLHEVLHDVRREAGDA